jgi:serine/threonine-protein kinase
MNLTSIICPHCHQSNAAAAKSCQHCGTNVVLNSQHIGTSACYRITRIIKEGGHGAIYAGVDSQGNTYAIKEMLDRFTDQRERAEALNRFRAEVQLLQKLNHPRIPRVYSHFIDRGHSYLVMDLVDGEDLEQIVEREGHISEARVLGWAIQICNVLEYLHQRGLIYRDMKPSNVMVDHKDQRIKIVDFGIANTFKPAEAGQPVGTQGYSPPEQYQGFATPASDIYALGATLHHLLTGRDPREYPPFEFPPARSLQPTISAATSDALARALSTEPAQRFGSVGEFRTVLRTQMDMVNPSRRRPAPEHNVILPRQSARQVPTRSSRNGQATPPLHAHRRAAPLHGAMLTETPAPATSTPALQLAAGSRYPPPPTYRNPNTPPPRQQAARGQHGWVVISFVLMLIVVVLALVFFLLPAEMVQHYLSEFTRLVPM